MLLANVWPHMGPRRASPEGVGRQPAVQVLFWLPPPQPGPIWQRGTLGRTGASTWPSPALTLDTARVREENSRKYDDGGERDGLEVAEGWGIIRRVPHFKSHVRPHGISPFRGVRLVWEPNWEPSS